MDRFQGKLRDFKLNWAPQALRSGLGRRPLVGFRFNADDTPRTEAQDLDAAQIQTSNDNGWGESPAF